MTKCSRIVHDERADRTNIHVMNCVNVVRGNWCNARSNMKSGRQTICASAPSLHHQVLLAQRLLLPRRSHVSSTSLHVVLRIHIQQQWFNGCQWHPPFFLVKLDVGRRDGLSLSGTNCSCKKSFSDPSPAICPTIVPQ